MNPSKTRFSVACPNCGVGLKVAECDLGQVKTCPNCASQFQLPSATEANRIEAANRTRREEFGFLCRLCGSRIYVSPNQVGTKLKCPDCHAVNLVRRPPKQATKEPTRTRTSDHHQPSEHEYRLSNVNDAPRPSRALADQPLFAFHCRICDALLHARRDAVGRQVKCADCGTALVVPYPPPVKKDTVVLAEDPGIAINAAAPRAAQEVINVERLMLDADAKVSEKLKQRPQPIRRPFLDGVYTFPFYLSSLAYVGVMGFMGSLILMLITMTIELQGRASIVGILLMVTVIFLGIPLFGILCNYLLSIVHWTAMGYPRVGESPPFELFQFVRHVAFLVNAFSVSALPGLLLGLLVPHPWLRFPVMMLGVFFLYPIVLLSMLDAESLASFFSRFVWTTLRTLPGPWSKFYLSALVAVGCVVVVQVGAWLLPHPYWMNATVVAVTFALILYFRLIGRLAYVLDRTLPAKTS